MKASGRKKRVPAEFYEVMLSRATGWTYWDLVCQPYWFIEKLLLYMDAENMISQMKNREMEMKAKKLKAKGRRR